MDCSSQFLFRMAETFPSQSGLVVKDNPQEAIQSLQTFFQELTPYFNAKYNYPFRIFRGDCLKEMIWRFEMIESTKCLLNNLELKLAKIAAFRDGERDFIYIESVGEAPTGLYQAPSDCRFEHYAIIDEQKHPIDQCTGLVILNGKAQKIPKDNIRIRCLTKFNLVIGTSFGPDYLVPIDKIPANIYDHILDGISNISDLKDAILQFNDYEPGYYDSKNYEFSPRIKMQGTHIKEESAEKEFVLPPRYSEKGNFKSSSPIWIIEESGEWKIIIGKRESSIPDEHFRIFIRLVSGLINDFNPETDKMGNYGYISEEELINECYFPNSFDQRLREFRLSLATLLTGIKPTDFIEKSGTRMVRISAHPLCIREIDRSLIHHEDPDIAKLAQQLFCKPNCWY